MAIWVVPTRSTHRVVGGYCIIQINPTLRLVFLLRAHRDLTCLRGGSTNSQTEGQVRTTPCDVLFVCELSLFKAAS
eukprot:12685430-Heterocapsa_arctica.AAC.1